MKKTPESEHADQTPPIDGRIFDLLVDGELDSARQHELLSRLDATPDGWRRCALAFLEAQAWRSDLRANMVTRPVGTPGDIRRDPAGRSRLVTLGRWGLLALGLMLAFGTGWLTRPHDDARPAQPVAATSAGAAQRAVQAPNDTVEKAPRDDNETAPQLTSSLRMAGILTLQIDDHGQTREMRVPVLDASGVDVQRLLEQEPAVRSSAIQALERRGHKVETHRQVLTVDLKDGRKLLLPVDQVDVRAANRVYQ